MISSQGQSWSGPHSESEAAPARGQAPGSSEQGAAQSHRSNHLTTATIHNYQHDNLPATLSTP